MILKEHQKGLLCQVKKLTFNYVINEKPVEGFKQRNGWSDVGVRSFWWHPEDWIQFE